MSAKGLPEYRIWSSMKSRCFNPNTRNFHRYGGRGISVHDSWRRSFSQFLEDVGPRPSGRHSLDRYPNNDGNYEPGNVRWATSKEQKWSRLGAIATATTLLGHRLLSARIEADMTQRELGRCSGISYPSICEIETGIISDITLQHCEALARALRCKPAWLAGWK